MAERTAIAWCDATFNPWHGCTKVSPGCRNCYAESLSRRYGHDLWGPNHAVRLFDDRHWAEPLAWARKAGREGVRRRVFCGSMCDVFENHPTLNLQYHRERLWRLIEDTPELDWLLLTKRPENIGRFAPGGFGLRPNVWLGTSVEDQRRIDERTPILLRVPALVRFLSVEPLLEPVRLRLDWTHGFTDTDGFTAISTERIHWVIVGGESQRGFRPMDLAWARAIVAECRASETPVFVKQLGGWPDSRANPDDWPEDLRVKEFPNDRSQAQTRESDREGGVRRGLT